MAIPTVEDFRLRFPEFGSVSDALIDILIAEAATWTDETWGTDQFLATLYLAAHLALITQRSTAFSSTGGAGQAVRSISFRDRTVSYQRPFAQTGDAQSDTLDDTAYGVLFKMYLRRHSPVVLIV